MNGSTKTIQEIIPRQSLSGQERECHEKEHNQGTVLHAFSVAIGLIENAIRIRPVSHGLSIEFMEACLLELVGLKSDYRGFCTTIDWTAYMYCGDLNHEHTRLVDIERWIRVSVASWAHAK